MTRPLRAMIYCRVSTDRQKEQHTIASQLRILPEFVQKNGWTQVGLIKDDGISGETIAARPGFQEVLRLADERTFDILAVIDFDRITRSRDEVEGAAICEKLRTSNVRIATPIDGIMDLAVPAQKLMVSIKRLFASFEKSQINERMVRGQLEKLAMGHRPSSRDPYGYVWVRAGRHRSAGSYQIHPEEGLIVRRIFELAAKGKGAASIAALLNEEGVPPPTSRLPRETAAGTVRSWKGEAWPHSTVTTILKSPRYKGDFVQFRATHKIVHKTPAIVDEQLWLRVQTEMQNRRFVRTGETTANVLLSGLLVCGECGYAMSTGDTGSGKTSDGKKRFYYRCMTSWAWKRLRVEKCANRWHRADDIDERVWTTIVEMLTSRDRMARAASLSAEDLKAGDDWKKQLETFRRKLAHLEDLESEILTRRRRGLLSSGACDRELLAIKADREFVERNVRLAEAQLADAGKRVAQIAAFEAFAAEFRRTIGKLSREDRRATIEAFVARPAGSIRVNRDGSIEIRGRLAESAGGLLLEETVSAKSA